MTSTEDLDANIQSLSKAAFLEVEYDVKDLSANTKLFISTLNTYSSLRQVSKFFLKLFSHGTTIITNKENVLSRGKIVPQVLQACAKCITELPPGQTIELWEIFNEVINSWRKLAFHSHDSSGALFYVSQIFSTFLLHARLFYDGLPSNMLPKVENLIHVVNENLAEMCCILKDTDEKCIPCQSSVLLLCYAAVEIRLAYNVTYRFSQMRFPTLERLVKVLDFSILNPSLNEELDEFFSLYLAAEDKCRIYCLVQLLMQKIRVLKMKESLSVQEEAHFHQIIVFLLLLLNSLSNENFNDWNRDLSTLDVGNYGTAIWDSLCRIFPQIYNSLTSKQSHGLCTLMMNRFFKPPMYVERKQNLVQIRILMQDIFRSEFCQESAELQSDIIICAWERSRTVINAKRTLSTDSDPVDPQSVLNSLSCFNADLIKLNSTTPKSDEGLNSLWTALQEIALKFNQLLQSTEPLKQTLKIASAKEMIKVLEYLSLESLLPGNQIKCLIGFSVLFLSVPEHTNDLKAGELARDLMRLIMCIFEGPQKILLFDFVDRCLYFKAVIKKLDALNLLSADHHDVNVKFLGHLIRLLIVETKMLPPLEELFCKLANNMTESTSSALTVLVLLQRLSLTLQLRMLKSDKKIFCGKLVSSLASGLLPFLKGKADQDINCYFYSLIINSYSEVINLLPCLNLQNEKAWHEVVSGVFDIGLRLLYDNEEKEVRNLLQFFCKLCSSRQKLANFLPDNFIATIWKAVRSYLNRKLKKVQEMAKALPLDLSSKKLSSEFKNPAHACPAYTYPIIEDFSQPINLISLNQLEVDLLHSISSGSSENEFTEIMNELHTEMEILAVDMSRFDALAFRLNLWIIRYLFQPHTDLKQPYTSQLLQNILTILHYIASQGCGSPQCLLVIRIPLLQFFYQIFTEDKVKLLGHFPLQSLHICAVTDLHKVTSHTVLFVKIFQAMSNLMFGLTSLHHNTVITERATFVSYISMMLKLMVQASNQTVLDKQSKKLNLEVELCVLNLNKLLVYLSDNKLVFSKFAPHLIADYVNCVQHITIHSLLKPHLIVGIEYIIKMCSEKSLHMLSANLKGSCLEIYNNLVRNYNHYDHFC